MPFSPTFAFFGERQGLRHSGVLWVGGQLERSQWVNRWLSKIHKLLIHIYIYMIKGSLVYEASVLRTFKNCSHTTHHTPLCSYTTLFIHHSVHTPLIIHHSSYTTHQYTTHHTPLIIHRSSDTTHQTPLIIHHSSHTTHHPVSSSFKSSSSS